MHATPHDNQSARAYASAMVSGEPHIVLTLDTKEPIELGAFVGTFTSLGNEYEQFIKETNPDLVREADMSIQ